MESEALEIKVYPGGRQHRKLCGHTPAGQQFPWLHHPQAGHALAFNLQPCGTNAVINLRIYQSRSQLAIQTNELVNWKTKIQS